MRIHIPWGRGRERAGGEGLGNSTVTRMTHAIEHDIDRHTRARTTRMSTHRIEISQNDDRRSRGRGSGRSSGSGISHGSSVPIMQYLFYHMLRAAVRVGDACNVMRREEREEGTCWVRIGCTHSHTYIHTYMRLMIHSLMIHSFTGMHADAISFRIISSLSISIYLCVHVCILTDADRSAFMNRYRRTAVDGCTAGKYNVLHLVCFHAF